MTRPTVTVIILNHNGMRYLNKCLESIRKGTGQECEVIFVDNASTDGSVDYIRGAFPWVRLVVNKANLGYAKANNEAAMIAQGEYIFFLNIDAWVEPNTVQELLKAAEMHGEVTAFAPAIMDYEGKTKLSLGMGCDIFGYSYPIFAGKTFYVDGAALFIRRRIFQEVGAFDQRYFIFNEDVDLGWRLRLYGHRIATVAGARVYHKSGGVVTGGVLQQTKTGYTTSLWRRYLGERNEICTLLKNYGLITLFFIVPLYVTINVMEVMVFLTRRKIKVVNIYLRAWLWNLKNLRTTLGRRMEIQRRRKISDREIMQDMHRSPMKVYVFRQVGIPQFME